ncbi:MAG: MFS transporter [Ilumatobacter sp.]|uniref:MFS transporter n=1 Tax=Ilumatobacter sp. TaxID=1967498 RepID=UPI00261F3055|nr:MFS transporter [Ilumatobacter sp.]MDJ0770960.1 MFS transporter [Ilumatobacter sp.]
MNPDDSHAHMGVVAQAARVATPDIDPRRARTIMIVLAGCTALQMTSYGMIFPLFARKISDFGDSVAVLAISVMAYSLAGVIMAPIMGLLADRLGRRPLILGSFAVFAAAFAGYYVAATSVVFIVIRGLAGALTAGLGPATMGLIADIAPRDERARWIGVVGGGTSAGFIVGPVVGGLLYDRWGYGPPFLASIGIALLTLLVAIFTIPETNTREQRRRAALHEKRAERLAPDMRTAASFVASLPHPLLAFGTLLFVNLSMIFAWFFVDPQLPFYAFDDLNLSTAKFGAMISCYGWAALIGHLALGRSSDRFGRKPILVLGLVLHSAQYCGLMLSDVYGVIIAAFVIAGLGEALVNPALSAAYLDITPEEHRSRAMGIKTAVGSLGSLLAPALATITVGHVPPEGAFVVSAVLILLTGVVVLVALRLPARTGGAGDRRWEASEARVLAAQTALRNLTVSAATARKLRSPV